jgi:hypothetical protein
LARANIFAISAVFLCLHGMNFSKFGLKLNIIILYTIYFIISKNIIHAKQKKYKWNERREKGFTMFAAARLTCPIVARAGSKVENKRGRKGEERGTRARRRGARVREVGAERRERGYL